MVMKHLETYYRIAAFIAAEIAETISAEEKAELEQWLSQDPLHPEIYRRILRRLENGEEVKCYRYEPSVKADWEKVKRQVNKGSRRMVIQRNFYRYAAVIILLIGVAIAYVQLRKNPLNPEVTSLVKQEVIQAGSSKAVLTLANGEKVVLEEVTTDSIQADGVLIERTEGGLSYQKADEKAEDEVEVFNIISIPNGGEYRLTLADGTKVWVNSASELKYPIKFVGDTRTVYIQGEAYFEVVKDATRPFIVKTINNMEIKVLGTHFNISAYAEDETIATTLAEGKVEVTNGEEKIDLIPNQQAIFEKKSEKFTRRNVDAYQYISWKDGKFIFEEETLEIIMERLSRWYNIQVFFKENSTRQLRFSGDLEKYEDFSTVLRMLEKVSHIQVEIKDKTIFIGQ